MPSRVGENVGIKVVSTVPGYPTGIVVVFDHAGAPAGIVDGPTRAAWNRKRLNADLLASEVGGVTAATPEEAVHGADIVTTATPSTTAFFAADVLKQRVHVNTVGAFTPAMVEIPPEYVREAFVAVDDRAAAGAEAGDLIQAGKEPDIDIAGRLADTLSPSRSLHSLDPPEGGT